MLPALAAVGPAEQASFRTPYASREPLRLGPVVPPATVPRYTTVELTIDAAGVYDDPFDPKQVRLDATVTEADGRTYSVPGFLDRPFRRGLVEGVERLQPDGPARWRLRIAPETEGEVRLRVVFADSSGEKAQSATFRCVASGEKGFVRAGSDDRRYFVHADGSTYWPLGLNMAYASPRGTYDYDDWLAKLGDHGGNFVRLWLSPSWTTLAQELPGRPEEGRGLGQIDLANAWRLDRVLASARSHGVYAQLCLDASAVLRQSGPAAWWGKTPHNSDQGGPLRIWREFWTNEAMDRLYQNRLRYLVARYGADAHVFGWEFWNEVDRVSEFETAVVRDWHQRMARILGGLDAYRHPRTTSVGATAGMRPIDLVPELDLMQSHSVDSADPAGTVAAQQSRKSAWGKPHFFGMIAADGADPRADDDPEGMQIHDPLWASIATGASGGAMGWWWDRLVAEKDLFRLYDAPSRFLSGVDWSAERFRQTDVALSLANPKTPVAPGDLTLEGGVPNGPQATLIAGGVLKGPVPASLLHGRKMHPELHNPVTIRVRADRPTAFEIGVSLVSGDGGGNLRVALDGSSVLARDFPDPDGDERLDDLRQYRGTFSIPLSKGVHTLRVENTGADWVRVGYRLVGVVPRKGPPLNAWAVVGDGTAMAWVRLAGRTWRAVCEQRRILAPAPPSVMRLRGLRSGTWRTEVWDTWAGRPVSTVRARVGIEGTVRIALPGIAKDVAVKMVREGK